VAERIAELDEQVKALTVERDQLKGQLQARMLRDGVRELRGLAKLAERKGYRRVASWRELAKAAPDLAEQLEARGLVKESPGTVYLSMRRTR